MHISASRLVSDTAQFCRPNSQIKWNSLLRTANNYDGGTSAYRRCPRHAIVHSGQKTALLHKVKDLVGEILRAVVKRIQHQFWIVRPLVRNQIPNFAIRHMMYAAKESAR